MTSGVRDACLAGMAIEWDPEAYNAVGEHYPNDATQARWIMWLMIPAALAAVAFVLWMIFE